MREEPQGSFWSFFLDVDFGHDRNFRMLPYSFPRHDPNFSSLGLQDLARILSSDFMEVFRGIRRGALHEFPTVTKGHKRGKWCHDSTCDSCPCPFFCALPVPNRDARSTRPRTSTTMRIGRGGASNGRAAPRTRIKKSTRFWMLSRRSTRPRGAPGANPFLSSQKLP